jgi:PAS domain S-box-containing protein
MSQTRVSATLNDRDSRILWKEADRIVEREWHAGSDGVTQRTLIVRSPAEPQSPRNLSRLEHEYGLHNDLNHAWAALPLELIREGKQTRLVLADPGGEPLDRFILGQFDTGTFLRIAIHLSVALGHLHERGLIHRDIKPSNVLVNPATGEVWLTGFGIASRLPRERLLPDPPENMVGTFAYMAPEQTGRMNRSVDSRSDLYSLGVTLYEMLTGTLPFAGTDPIEWMHCHIARKPAPPDTKRAFLHPAVSAIVMKLLAKTAEERYQTARGLAEDLRHCLAEWEVTNRIEPFPIGARDTPDRLLISEKLYGRSREIEALCASFEQVVANGKPELVLVSGYSGVGKSSVVNELHTAFVPPHGLFASGKFDQYKRDIPYATLAQAFQGLVCLLLRKSEAELEIWRDSLRDALGTNGQLIVNLVPELTLIIGEQPAVSHLPPQDAQGRFQLAMRRFIGVFAKMEHPLVLFLDDLQWMDAATLELLEDLLTGADVQHLLVIGAYRDNEVSGTHPLMRTIDTIRQAGTAVHHMVLAALAPEDIAQWIADSLHSTAEQVLPLARLVNEKTGGNPFFTIQFLHTLVEASLLTFDHRHAQWCWNLACIRAMGYTDNVADLMISRLNRLSAQTRTMLQTLACIGSDTTMETLSIVSGIARDDIHAVLWDAVRLELIIRCAIGYKFAHDRVQEAAYSSIPEASRAEVHLRIGRLLKAQIPEEKHAEAIFEIVNQLNRGMLLINAESERQQLVALNLCASRRARDATAYAAALAYLSAGASLLPSDAWEHRYEQTFALELSQAECEFLTGDLPGAETRLVQLSMRARSTVDQAAVTCLRVDLYTALNQSERAVQVCLDYLRGLGVHWSPHPSVEEGRAEFQRILTKLGDRSIDQLFTLPLMDDPSSLATMDVLTKAFPPALFTDANLLSLAACWAVNLSLARGNSDGSCVAYVWLGMIAGPHFDNYAAGFQFGNLGYELVEKRGLKRFQARTCLWFGQFVVPWTKHVRASRDLFRRAFDAANKVGDLTIAAYACNNLNTNFLAVGDPLATTQHEAEHGLEFARNARFNFVVDIISAQLRLIRTLRGLLPKFGCFNDSEFDETAFERHLASEPSLALPECWYWTRKLQARFYAGDYRSAIVALRNAERLLWTSPNIFERAECLFYGALCHAALCDSDESGPRREHLDALMSHQTQFDIWARNSPENFEHRFALVRAEIARLEGRAFDAMRLYELAIRSARENGFVHNEALANELAGRFHLSWGLDTSGYSHLQHARACYAAWGADGKVRQLDERYPRLTALDMKRTAVAEAHDTQQLDIATLAKASQALSSEMELPRLIENLMTILLQDAGADRGLLLTPQKDAYTIEAEAQVCGDNLLLRHGSICDARVPESVIRYAMRTQQSVVIDDAGRPNPFTNDPYLIERQPRSVFCLALVRQGKLTGLLYLENSVASHVFTERRARLLELLASQAAIALENARLYSDLCEREAKVRRLVDSNIIGIIIWDVDGGISDANDAFLGIVGYRREEIASGRVRWTELTPPEWRADDERTLAQARATGTAPPREKEYFRSDGTRVPVLIGIAMFGERRDHGVAFVLDLTERRRVEREMRENERRYREVQSELERANRIATMGQLSASIAHEVNQPIAAALTNADAALRWINVNPPNMQEVSEALARIVHNSRRASTVVERIRALMNKAPPSKENLDINETILEVIALTRGEITRQRVEIRTEFDAALPVLQGDRVQLQQVVLNLIVNALEAMVGENVQRRQLVIGTTRSTPDTVRVSVQDSGVGLPPEQVEHVFDAFYTTKPAGLGMGLSICRSIIQSHGGELLATNAATGGAMFEFTLPVMQADE